MVAQRYDKKLILPNCESKNSAKLKFILSKTRSLRQKFVNLQIEELFFLRPLQLQDKPVKLWLSFEHTNASAVARKSILSRKVITLSCPGNIINSPVTNAGI